jgi:peptidoglycan hydrolase-like protein with peptidoglycan-binding domain
MSIRTRIGSLVATGALVGAMLVAGAAPGSATSTDACGTAWGTTSSTAVDVPVRPGPYIGPNDHYTDCRLYYGVTGAGVLALQRALRICYGHQIALDGWYGNGTIAALKSVQASHGIKVDGLYGNQTRDTIQFFMGYHGPMAVCAPDPYFPNDLGGE